MKKIAVLLPTLSLGGAERLVFEELSFFKHDKRFYFEIHVVFEPGYLFNKFKELEMPIYIWNAPHKSLRMFFIFLKIVRYLRRKRFDILHVHLLNHYGSWIGRFAEVNCIATAHSDHRYDWLERLCLRQSSLVLGCGVQVVKNISSFIPKQKIRLLNNAIRPVVSNNNTEYEEILKQLDVGKDYKIVLSLGRLIESKGYDLLVDAFKHVIKKETKVVLLLGGDGPDRKKLEQQIMASGMQEYIRLLGFVDNVNELLEICDIYVNSSRREGLPMTLLEAMANGKPIVATNVGSNCEVVKNEETGLLVDPERPDLLAKAILKLLNDKELRDTLGTQAFELFKKNYTIEKHCKTLAEEYLA
ncbi:MAG: glycosyltransferase family 4 protein [Candidatus Brocadia sp.]|nr:glycosyltransferase family 4 protein [Candidatus Brocadia sp.]